MQSSLIFAIWLTALGSAIHWGNGWWTAVVVTAGMLCFFFRCLRKKKWNRQLAEVQYELPAEFFTAPPLEAAGPFLTAPEEEAGLLKLEAEIARRDDRERTALAVLFLVIVCTLPLGKFFGSLFLVWAGSAFTAAILIVLAGRAICRKQRLRWNPRLQLLRDGRLAIHPRPPLQPGPDGVNDHFCRHYSTAAEAEAACLLAERAKIDFLVYPQDSLRLVAGGNYVQLQEWFRQFDATELPKTFGQGAAILAHRLYPYRRHITETAFQMLEHREPPPLTPALEHVRQELKRENWEVLDEELFHQEILRRPVMSERLFCSYWPTAEEADIALRIRNLAVTHLFREVTMLPYPNDPLPLLTYIVDDSLETVEFLLAVEEVFQISIPDDAVAKMPAWSFAELVAFIREKQRGADRRSPSPVRE